MAGFDFVECSTRSYSYIWQKRYEIGRLCGAVVLFKVMSFIAILLLGLEEFKLRQGLFLLPSYFLEGWAIALVMAGAINALKKTPIDYDLQKRNAIAGAIVYTLIKLMLSFVLGMAFEGQQVNPDGTVQQNGSLEAFAIACIMLVIIIWSFRFLWVYVPVALGYGIEEFLVKFKKFSASFYMIGLWLLCFVPFAGLFLLLLEFFKMLLPQGAGLEPSLMYMNAVGIVQAFFHFGVSLVSSLAMAYAVHSVFTGTNKPPKLF